MGLVDVERILNESPQKRLLIQFNNLKENYNEQTALEYKNVYSNSPLSFIIENSRLIFSEPFYGYEFYKNIVCGDNELCIFTKYEDELRKVQDFIDENSGKMHSKQLEMYQALSSCLQMKINDLVSTINMAKFTADKEDNEEFEVELSNTLYSYLNGGRNEDTVEKIRAMMKNASREIFFVYAPYVNSIIRDCSIIEPNLSKHCVDVSNNEDIVDVNVFKPVVESVMMLSNLYCDKTYREAVNTIQNVDCRFVMEEYASGSFNDIVNSLFIERVDSLDTMYVSPKDTVNSIFGDFFESEMFADDNQQFKDSRLKLQKLAYDTLMESVLFEYQNASNTSDAIRGFHMFKEGTTIDEALQITMEHVNELNSELGITIVENDDSTDKDLEDFEKKMNDETKDDSSKKVEAPKAKNLANKIQFKAMDAEVQQRKKMANASQKGQEIKNSVKAVSKLPMNVVNSIEGQIKQIDDADDTRRRKFMLKPGFRKKIFRNLKLALLYGTTAQIKKAYIPLVAIGRHFSKEKDRRIRNEVVRDLETEIKICDEKINDAASAGDNEAKYSLMRIKSKLENERLRVRTNSKYI